MRTPSKMLFLFTLLSVIITLSPARADDHIVLERVRSGMGIRSPSRSTEIWMNDQALYMNSGRIVTIVRYDLQKRWSFSPQSRRYIEESLVPPKTEEGDSADIHRMGWDYTPTYDWTVADKPREEVILDLQCKLITAEGDADYASASLELWVTDKAPINIERFNERVTAPASDFDWPGLIRARPALKGKFFMRIINRAAHPIAPEMTYETKVTKIESATPPPNIYEIPDGFQKVKSSDELTD
jgi:hypothetical protein